MQNVTKKLSVGEWLRKLSNAELVVLFVEEIILDNLQCENCVFSDYCASQVDKSKKRGEEWEANEFLCETHAYNFFDSPINENTRLLNRFKNAINAYHVKDTNAEFEDNYLDDSERPSGLEISIKKW